MQDNQILENILNRIHEWIRAADQKIGIFIAFQAIVIGFIISYSFRVIEIPNNDINRFGLFLLFFSLLAFLYSFIRVLLGLIPKTVSNPKTSLIYFGEISKMSLGNYLEQIAQLTDEEYRLDIINQIHISSIIASQKHECIRHSMIIFIISTSTWIIATIFIIG
jgi:hypothetical protein